MARQTIEALYDGGIFRPRGRVDLTPGSVVRLEFKEVAQPRRSTVDLDGAYSALDEKYPTANVRAAYGDRSELHRR